MKIKNRYIQSTDEIRKYFVERLSCSVCTVISCTVKGKGYKDIDDCSGNLWEVVWGGLDSDLNKFTISAIDLTKKHLVSIELGLVVENYYDLELILENKSVDYGVYLIECSYAKVKLLKIGKSSNCKTRIINMRCDNPLIKHIGTLRVENYSVLEKQLHSQYKELTYAGEWFKYSNKILARFKEHPLFIPA